MRQYVCITVFNVHIVLMVIGIEMFGKAKRKGDKIC